MFDVGFWEILLIGILALVVIGPERLPGAARQAGYFFGKARRYIEGVREEVASELDVNEFKRMLHNQEVQITELQQQLKSGIDDVKSELPTSDFLTESPSTSIQDKTENDSTTDNDIETGSEVDTESDADAGNENASQQVNQKAAQKIIDGDTNSVTQKDNK